MIKKFNEAQVQAIIKEYLAGIPVMVIAKRHNCSDTYPSRLARKHGHPTRGGLNSRSIEREKRAWQRAMAIGPVVV